MLWGMSDAIFSEYTNVDYKIYTSIFYRLVLAKLVCCFALHFMLSIHISRGLDVMKYMINHSENFTDFFIPFTCTTISVMISIYSNNLNIQMLTY